MKNKIGWCDLTWNPVIGCKNDCEYCYARNLNTRFRFVKFWNEPEWREDSFKKKFPKKPQRIFVGSMSEIYYWKKEWMKKVLNKIREYPQHTFQFLTKFPRIYLEYDFPENCWLGVTATKREDIDKNWTSLYRTLYGFNNNKFCKNIKLFCSIEPFLNVINPEYLKYYDWVIIGAETGNRKGKIIPKKEWIESIVNYCRAGKIPVYLKDSLKDIYPEEIKEFPETAKGGNQ